MDLPISQWLTSMKIYSERLGWFLLGYYDAKICAGSSPYTAISSLSRSIRILSEEMSPYCHIHKANPLPEIEADFLATLRCNCLRYIYNSTCAIRIRIYLHKRGRGYLVISCGIKFSKIGKPSAWRLSRLPYNAFGRLTYKQFIDWCIEPIYWSISSTLTKTTNSLSSQLANLLSSLYIDRLA